MVGRDPELPRSLAADESTDGVPDWGRDSSTAPQAARITGALVDALARETSPVPRESIGIPRPTDDALVDYWSDIEEWAARRG